MEYIVDKSIENVKQNYFTNKILGFLKIKEHMNNIELC